MAGVAQPAEHLNVAQAVAGSNPVARPIPKNKKGDASIFRKRQVVKK